MFDMGFMEIALIAGIGLLVLGPERLPVAARMVGRYVGQARRFVGNFQRQIEQEVRLDELNKKIMRDTEGQRFTNNDGSESSSTQADHSDSAESVSGNRSSTSNAGPGDESDSPEHRNSRPEPGGKGAGQ